MLTVKMAIFMIACALILAVPTIALIMIRIRAGEVGWAVFTSAILAVQIATIILNVKIYRSARR
jgi:hypothetical protein